MPDNNKDTAQVEKNTDGLLPEENLADTKQDVPEIDGDDNTSLELEGERLQSSSQVTAAPNNLYDTSLPPKTDSVEWFSSIDFPMQITVFLSLLLVCSGLFYFLQGEFTEDANVVFFFPIAIASWFWGVWVSLGLAAIVYAALVFALSQLGYGEISSIVMHGDSFVLAMVLLLGVFAGLLSGTRRSLRERKKRQVEIEENLRARSRELRESRIRLAGRSKRLLLQNKKLDKVKKAMLNLLEDARSFEEDLRREKASVEKKVEEQTMELREEESRLVSSIESLPVGYVLTDNADNVIMTNQAVAQIFGNPVDKPLVEYLEETIKMKTKCMECRTSRKPVGPEEIDYENKILRIHLTPVTAGLGVGEVGGVVVLIENITEAKLLERTREEFFAVASHELRTPLTAIRGNLALIDEYYSDQIKDESLLELLDDMHSSSVRLIKLVNDFLDVSRLEQKKIEFKIEDIDLEELAKETINELDATAKEKNIYLKVTKDEGSHTAKADKERSKQALINLIGNALKFTVEGGITVNLVKSEGFLKVQVTDTGPGIVKEGQKLLFRKFQQTSEHMLTRDVTSGAGLGLYISKLLVNGMGGNLFLENSEVGKGSTFTFTLPLA